MATNSRIDFIEFPVASVEGIQTVERFYTKVFGWKFALWGDDYIDTKSSGTQCGFNADPEHRVEQPVVVIHVPDLDTAYANVRQAGGHIVKEIFAFPGGRRFHFRDPSGNVLAVWSDIPDE